MESLSTNFADEEASGRMEKKVEKGEVSGMGDTHLGPPPHNHTQEYPSSTEIHSTCVKQLANLLHAEGVCGTSTVGSSEAIMLGVLAMKHRWRAARAAAGKPTDKPNMVTPSSIHVCHEKGRIGIFRVCRREK